MKNRKVDGIIEEWKSTAVYVNADWNYADKYFLQGTLTAETSTRFGRNAAGGSETGRLCLGDIPVLAGGLGGFRRTFLPEREGY